MTDRSDGRRHEVTIDKDRIVTNSDSVAQAVKATRAKYMAAQTFRDVDGVLECWFKDSSVLLPPGQPTVVGWDNVRAWYSEQLAITELGLKVQYDEIFGAHEDADEPGNWAVARASYTGTIFIKEKDGSMKTIDDRGKILETHRRGEDGQWRFTTHMWSSDIDANTNAQAH